MPSNIPYIVTGSGTTTVTPPTPKRMLLVGNTDPTNALTVTWNNGGPNTWPLAAGEKTGKYVKGGVTSVTLTGSGSWAVEMFD